MPELRKLVPAYGPIRLNQQFPSPLASWKLLPIKSTAPQVCGVGVGCCDDFGRNVPP